MVFEARREAAHLQIPVRYRTRSELIAAQLDDASYTYAYDNIGNRTRAQEAADEVTQCTSNELNQYTSVGTFTPEFDPAGNQTLVKTSTGIWRITYNAENRPTTFTSDDGSTVVDCTYDYMGRRATKKVTTNGEVTLHHRYIYRGYLQIAACDLTRTASPCPSVFASRFAHLLRRDKLAHPLGPHPTHRHSPPRHPKRWHMVHLWLGPHQKHHRTLLPLRLHPHHLHLLSLRFSNRRR